MFIVERNSISLCVILFSASLFAAGTGPAAMNPKISVIGDFVGQSGTENQKEDGFHVREVEIGIQADVDPYARADLFIGGLNDQGGAPELEEAYVTLLSLPWGFQGRGGKFRADYGKLNRVHPHEYAQVDAPLALEKFYGEGGINSTGFELSRLFPIGSLYTEATFAVLQDLGAAAEPRSHTITVIDQGSGNPVEISVPGESSTPSHRFGNFAQTAKLRAYKDLTDTTNIDLGLSGAVHQPKATATEEFDRRRFAALDLTVRWKPLSQGVYRSFVWRTEGHYTDQDLVQVTNPVDGSIDEPAARVHRRGAYSDAEVQPVQRWRFGVRGDYAEDPAVRDDKTPHISRALAPYATFTLTEFNRFRLQYERRENPGHEKENLGFLQWTFVLGPHGAHPF